MPNFGKLAVTTADSAKCLAFCNFDAQRSPYAEIVRYPLDARPFSRDNVERQDIGGNNFSLPAPTLSFYLAATLLQAFFNLISEGWQAIDHRKKRNKQKNAR